MLDPGATRSTTDDMLENGEIVSFLVDEATVVAVEMHPGVLTSDVRASLPAAMAVRAPAFRRLSMEVLRASASQAPEVSGVPPRLMFTDARVAPPGRLLMLAKRKSSARS